MHIVADQAIPAVAEAFASLGEVTLVNGRQLTSSDLKAADVLLVRSVTQVNARLLDDTNIKFVGSATSGIDHVDMHYLQQRNIQFVHAGGANAQAVAEYVVCAIVELGQRYTSVLQAKVLGIIGYGHVGSRLAHIAECLGFKVMINDPPLEVSGQYPDVCFESVATVLQHADIVSLHVPLVAQAPWPTQHMVDQSFLRLLKPGGCLINSSRGAVVKSSALLNYLQQGGIAVLDVWEKEPNISTELLQAVTLATPHVAGYSLEAKHNATAILHKAVSDGLALSLNWTPKLPVPAKIESTQCEFGFNNVIKQTYDIVADDMSLRNMASKATIEQADYFDGLRTGYQLRREFSAWQCQALADKTEQTTLERLGFRFSKD